MPSYIRAIVWAQWRTLRNYYPRYKGGTALAVAVSLLWYGAWAAGSVLLAAVVGMTERTDALPTAMTSGLFATFLYWQLAPLMLATTGASLDLKRLLVYPVPRVQLFAIEIFLRISISLDMVILLTAVSFGLAWNPRIPVWAPLAFPPFVLMNLFLSAGLRDLLTRVMSKKRVREAAVFLIVMVAALPQYFVLRGTSRPLTLFSAWQPVVLPWAAAGRLASGKLSVSAVLSLLAWTLAGYAFGRWQFNKSLRFDAEAAKAADRPVTERGSFADRIFRLPSKVLPDPVGAMVEKDIRFLSRAPRFRLVFLMGFSFGLLVWLPLVFGHQFGESFLSENVLTLVSVYSMLLLGEVLIWNSFAYDRSAAQFYHLAPVPFSKVLISKNLTALILMLFEISIITVVCAAIRLPLTGAKVVESFAVTLVMMLLLVSFGNLSSTYYPRPIDPSQSWRSSARGFQMLLIVIYPVASIPLALAYLARYAFDSQATFYLVLAFDLAFGAIIYRIAMHSAVDGIKQRKEHIIAALGQTGGPIT